MKVKLRWTIRLKTWAAKAGRKTGRYLASFAASIAVMLLVLDALGIYFSHQTAAEIAARAAVAASQTLRQGGDRAQAEKETELLVERSLAKFKGIEFRGQVVRVTISYKARSIVFRHVPGVKRFVTITATGRHPGD